MANQHVKQTASGNPRESPSEEELFPFEMGYLPARFQKKAVEELNESPENIEKGLKYLREMTKDKVFDGQIFDDHYIIQYLRYRKYNFERAFTRLKLCTLFRKSNADMFKNITFDALSPLTRKNSITFLSKRCPEGCAIVRLELENWNPDELPAIDVKRAITMLLMQSLHDPMTQVNGFKFIFNVKSTSLKQMRHCTPSNIYMIYYGTQECIPGRYKEVHFVNQSKIFDLAWTIAKPFLSRKLKQRIIFHSDPETLLNYFPRSVLPVEYGGEDDQHDLNMNEWFRKALHPDKIRNVLPPTICEYS